MKPCTCNGEYHEFCECEPLFSDIRRVIENERAQGLEGTFLSHSRVLALLQVAEQLVEALWGVSA